MILESTHTDIKSKLTDRPKNCCLVLWLLTNYNITMVDPRCAFGMNLKAARSEMNSCLHGWLQQQATTQHSLAEWLWQQVAAVAEGRSGPNALLYWAWDSCHCNRNWRVLLHIRRCLWCHYDTFHLRFVFTDVCLALCIHYFGLLQHYIIYADVDK